MSNPDVDRLDELITIAEFCKLARFSRNTFYKELREGRLSARQCGRRVYLLRSEVERWMRDMPAATVAAPKAAMSNPFVGATA